MELKSDNAGFLLTIDGTRIPRADDYMDRIVSLQYSNQDEALADFAGGEADVRRHRWNNCDRAARIQQRYGWGAVTKAGELINVSRETARQYALCGYLFAEDDRAWDVPMWPYYNVARHEVKHGDGEALALLRDALSAGYGAGEIWDELRTLGGKPKKQILVKQFIEGRNVLLTTNGRGEPVIVVELAQLSPTLTIYDNEQLEVVIRKIVAEREVV